MIEVTIPGKGQCRFEHLVLDLNGTLALDGEIIEGVDSRLHQLSNLLNISIVTADTHGSAQRLGKSLPIKMRKIDMGEEQAQKLELVRQLGEESTVCIGNGSNDVLMLRESGLGICVVGPEGASSEALASCDLVVSDIKAALDLLVKPERLIATLRS